MTRKEITARIKEHLRRFEADSKINKRDSNGMLPFWHSGCWVGGRWLFVLYVSYQGASHLTTAQAEEYLAWLDAGNVGTHYQMKREYDHATQKS